MSEARLRIGYIPLVDAAALVVAADCGFAAAEGLEIELVREVSWSNVRDKLNIGLFDAAHLLSPMAIASSLGIGHVRIPVIAPFNLGLNGNAITVSPRLYEAMARLADGDLGDPVVSARALMRVVEARKIGGAEPLTFGMTFPFSNHNYQLRYWMAAGGVDPDEDVRLVVLPPPYMVESLANGHVDGFCVGAPWNSVAVQSGIGRILHFSCEIMAQVSEKVLAVRAQWAADHAETMTRLTRALSHAAAFVEDSANGDTVSTAVAKRIEVEPGLVLRTLTGNLRIASDGTTRTDPRYIRIGGAGVNRPDPVQAAWLYAQIVRWGQAPLTQELYGIAQSVFRPDLYDAALGAPPQVSRGGPADGIGAFDGIAFAPEDIESHLAAWRIKRGGRPQLSIVR